MQCWLILSTQAAGGSSRTSRPSGSALRGLPLHSLAPVSAQHPRAAFACRARPETLAEPLARASGCCWSGDRLPSAHLLRFPLEAELVLADLEVPLIDYGGKNIGAIRQLEGDEVG